MINNIHAFVLVDGQRLEEDPERLGGRVVNTDTEDSRIRLILASI